VARGVASIGSSAQHPVGYSILSSYFPNKRGAVMALNTSVSNVGTLVATPLATALLLVLGWRQIFFVVTVASVVMGLIYFFFRDYGMPNRAGSGRSGLVQGFASYRRVLKNRNMVLIALVFMVGGAGRDGGVNQIYFAPHLANDFGYSNLTIGILITAISIGSIAGPIFFGWLSDRFSGVRLLQVSLALSCVDTLWVAQLGPGEVMLFISLLRLHLLARDPDADHRRGSRVQRRPRRGVQPVLSAGLPLPRSLASSMPSPVSLTRCSSAPVPVGRGVRIATPTSPSS